MNEIAKSFLTVAITIVVTAALMLFVSLSALPMAYVLKDFWAWFIVPLGAPPVTWMHAYGLMLVSGIFLRSLKSDAPDDKAPGAEKAKWFAMRTFVAPPLMWVVGYVVQGLI